MTPLPATVHVVDDDDSVRRALGRLLASAGYHVALFASPLELLRDYRPETPGCLLLDVTMPDMNGLELQRLLAERDCHLPIVFLTGTGNISMSVEAMKGGATDFLTKPVDDEALLKAVGQAFETDRKLRQERQMLASIKSRLETLTPREHEVLVEVVRGRLNKQIAYDLGTVEKTIKVHRARVMEKMQVHSLAELVRIAERAGLVRD